MASQERLFRDAGAEREPFLLRDLHGNVLRGRHGLNVETTFEVAAADGLGGDFTFRRSITHARGRWDIGARTTLAARVLVGLTGGDPPPQKLLALGGLGTLRGYSYKELIDRNAALSGTMTVRVGAPPALDAARTAREVY